MKCIRQDGKIRRVANETAYELVGAGKAEYVQKSAWKKEVRGPVKKNADNG